MADVTNTFYAGAAFVDREACAPAKCAYCGRYGALGQCLGCGAPNAPAPSRAVTLTDPRDREEIDVTHLRSPGHPGPTFVRMPPNRVQR